MSSSMQQFLKRHWVGAAWCGAALIALALAALTRDQWWPRLRALAAADDPAEKSPEGHNHPHPHPHPHEEGHSEESSLELSPSAWKNIGLTTGDVRPRDFTRTVSVPAIVTERPGRSQVAVAAHLTGIVTQVHPIEGEAVVPGQPLFELRLTHEDLVTAQREFLQSLQELDVVRKELAWLKSFDRTVVEGGRIRALEFTEEKLNGTLLAQEQALLLHDLTAAQIAEIAKSRKLRQTLTVVAPPFSQEGDHRGAQHLFTVQKINVKPGQHITTGEPLALLADHCLLYVEGQAFEDDMSRLLAAANAGQSLEVASVADGGHGDPPLALPILYVADHVDEDSRALHFYLTLPNQIVRDVGEPGHRFVAWRYRPGERMEVRLPLAEPWKNQIVLPPEAVVEEGADAFVFEQNGDHFDRVAVHVIYRDKDAVVVENDGALAGATLAMSGAYQMHLALKNKSGGAVDPHAGHNH